MARTASDVLVERLIDWGVEAVFGLPGDGINGFMEALRKAKDRVRLVHTRHEEAAALAACAYAKFTGRLGVCFSTAAPGAIHLLNGLYDAKIDQAPVLAITGMTYHDLIGTHYLQDLNQDYLFQDVALFNQRIMGPAHVENAADLACRTALSHRAVAHLAFPIDYQVAEVGADRRSKRNIEGHTSLSYSFEPRTPPQDQLARAASVFAGKERIAILAGAGARGAGSELEEVADRLAAPIAKAMLGKEVVPDDSPFTTGSIGIVGTRPSSEVMKSCDALLIVGSSFPYTEYLPEPGQAAAVQLDDRPERIGLRYPVEVGLVGDAKATLKALVPLLPRSVDRTFLERTQQQMADWWKLVEARGTRVDTPMKPQVVAWNLSQLLEPDAILTGDSGTVTTWAGRMKLRRGQRFSFSGTLCSMAAGLPYAIGAQVAYPGRQVVAFTGDGSASMMMGDFATLVQEQLPVKVIVIKNNSLGLIRWEQMVFLGNPEHGIELSPIDFVKVAEGCGLPGLRIDDPRTCRDQLESALRAEGPALIEAVVDPYEPPLPPTITAEQATHLAEALARGEPNATRIGLTMTRNAWHESAFATAPSGAAKRTAKRVRESIEGKGRGE